LGWLATHFEVATLSEVGRLVNRDVATISRAVSNVEKRLMRSKNLKEQMDMLRKELSNNAIMQA
ncbi:MAG: hypothetical protein KKG47_12105, partial [Proteobacteria bacterium]|nr:hypothetical protein [Pseudomonadota bacterium]MBU1738219.1 hypothetical protein [Pseudomonadota bacterium]